jgi:hypothetical protein
MFRQIAPGGIVNKEIMNRKVDLSDALETVVPQNDGVKIAEEHNDPSSEHANDPAPEDIVPKQISNGTSQPADAFVPHQGADTEKLAEKPDSEPTNVAQEIVASGERCRHRIIEADIQLRCSNEYFQNRHLYKGE